MFPYLFAFLGCVLTFLSELARLVYRIETKGAKLSTVTKADVHI